MINEFSIDIVNIYTSKKNSYSDASLLSVNIVFVLVFFNQNFMASCFYLGDLILITVLVALG